MEQKDRLLSIDTALLGKWENDESGFLFEGMGIESKWGEVIIYHMDSSIIEGTYQVFIKEEIPYLTIVCPINGKKIAWEYIINLIDSGTGELKLSTTLGKELHLLKSGMV